MKSINYDQPFYAFSKDLKPLIHVAEGEEFEMLTCDCYGAQVTSEDNIIEDLDWSRTNPCTGPVYIDGVQTGDTIRVDIKEIKVGLTSAMAVVPNDCVVTGVNVAETRIINNNPADVTLRTECGEIRLPLIPMIGVIGVAPEGDPVPTATPDVHGGNMDCKLIGEGTKIYFKANTDGALFGCGDAHAVMGDGEVAACGAETSAKIICRIDKVKKSVIPAPLLETEDKYITIGSAKKLEDACQIAMDHMFIFITENTKFSASDAGKLMGLVGDIRICQIVDPQTTVRFEIPKEIMEKGGFFGIQ